MDKDCVTRRTHTRRIGTKTHVMERTAKTHGKHSNKTLSQGPEDEATKSSGVHYSPDLVNPMC